jgi:hypothetical protein
MAFYVVMEAEGINSKVSLCGQPSRVVVLVEHQFKEQLLL